MDEPNIDDLVRRRVLGDMVRRLREDAGFTQPELARVSGIAQSAVSRIETGERHLIPDVAWKLDKALRANGALVLTARDAYWGVIDPGIECSAYAILEGLASGERPEVSPTRRRDFMGVTGSIATGAMIGPHLVDQALERGSVSQDRLEWIENETQQIAHAVYRVPDQRPLLRSAMEQYEIIIFLLNEPQRTADRLRLTRAVANLCGSIAVIRQDILDEPRSDSRWLRAARAAALDAGDPYLADMTLVSMSFPDLYSGSPHRVISQLGPRLEARKARPNRGLAKLHGIAARANAVLGDKDTSRRHLATAQEILDRSPEPEIEAWESYNPAQLAFHAANAANALGDTRRTIEAANRSIEWFDTDWIDRFNVRMDKAIALHKAGEEAEACQVATDVITDPDLPLTNFGLKRNVAKFDGRLGKATSGPVADWRDAYHTYLLAK